VPGNCKTCGQEITPAASFCPNCGTKQRKEWDIARVVAVVVVVVAVMVLIIIVGNSPSTQPEDQHESEAKSRAFTLGEAMVDNARNPTSVRFDFASEMVDGSYCFSFRAQNGFGGMALAKIVVITAGNKVYQQNDTMTSPGFVRAWNAHCAGKTGISDATATLNYYAQHFGR
jgi:hypothetical protein